ncbi:AAA domain-containing protein [Pseudofrankia sp. BMG5.37]|uniref:AAA domain-containing protein n=1 Tax=Pseudofrankia sp. BMG5.37 TaxID=3050035 RepID=UPI0028958E15|nr:AAA domain-containing protein [Pseudofrankia sp. BMG5.37]MDT3446730.1 AAA domain-containing protein [Pseudofrankia sp. BMG5.37]
MSIRDVDAIVSTFLMTDDAGVRRYSPLAGGTDLDGTEILPGLLYRYRQLDAGSRAVSLQIFLDVGEIGGRLWDQEVKVLLRVANLSHPALPEVLDGGHLDADKIATEVGVRHSAAYIRTLSEEDIEASEIGDLTAAMQNDPVRALGQLWRLADALAILHDARIAHRNLWPGTLQFYVDGGHPALRISRFEMSALLSNILRASTVDSSGHETVRGLYLAQDARSLRYTPPERARFLLGWSDPETPRAPTDGPGSAEADTFGLAMIAAEWLLGTFDSTAPDAGAVPTLTDLLAFQRQVRVQVRTSPAIPPALGALLDDMLDPDPRGRPTSAQVLERLSRNHDGIVTLLEGAPGADSPPHLLLYLADTRDRLAEWGLIDPTDTDPRKIAEVIEQDTRGALVVESPDGAEPYLRNWRGTAPEKLRQARWVLIGPRAAWFCRPYEQRAKFQRTGELLTDVYVIGYVALRERLARPERDRLRKLEDVRLRRRIASVHVESDEIAPQVLNQLRRDRPDWKRLFETVREPAGPSPRERGFQRALDWLLEYQTAQLAARTYAFQRDPASPPNAAEVVLHWDRKRDRERRDRLPPLSAKLLGDSIARPAFGHFFADVSQGDEASLSYLRIRNDDRGTDTKPGSFRFVRHLGEDTVVVTAVAGAAVPEKGLLSPQDDDGTRIALYRQQDARDELVRNRVLVNRLLDPVSIRGDASRWRGAAGRLKGEGAAVVVDMLCHQPMFALQGPPGTGKTEISSQAVQACLRADPSARILVSAQSHYALDNLAARILTKLGLLDEQGRPQDADLMAIRIYTDRAEDRVDERLRKFSPGETAVRMRHTIRRRVRARLNSLVDGPQVREVAESWLGELDGSEIELGERLRRGANIVLVTCAAATQAKLVDNGAREPFDWVIVEEAAKAWPTELAMPLVRGLRWTMIGDHQQIGAYGAAEVERFLNTCADDPEPSIAEHFAFRKQYLEVFQLFGTMIGQAAPAGPGQASGPVRMLHEQRRMRDPISQVVSRSFYPVLEAPAVPAALLAPPSPAALAVPAPTSGTTAWPRPAAPKQDPSPPGPADIPAGLLLTRRAEEGSAVEFPEWLRERALVWVDTSGMHQDEGYWFNRYEADVVTRLARSLRPYPRLTARHEKESRTGLAILTPYRRQVDAIGRAGQELSGVVKTVDAFQGQEADLVIVSLVRDTARVPWDRPLGNIGHLADPARVNVMLSRARDVLVMVGSYEHFAGSGVPFWETVTATVSHYGIRRPAATVVA